MSDLHRKGISADRERIFNLFKDITEIDSLSFKERELADFIVKKLIGLGFEVSEDNVLKDYGGNAGNIHGYIKGNNPVLLSAHLDTVAPGNNKKAVLKDGNISPEGKTVLGADDAAGLCAVIEAVTLITENGIRHNGIEVLFTVAEEAYARGAKYFDYGTIRSKIGYVLDMGGEIGIAALSAPMIISFEITVSGKKSHAGFCPQNGISAIAAAGKALAKLKFGWTDKETNLNIGYISGGGQVNIVSDNCVIKGEIRSLNNGKAEALYNEMCGIFETECKSLGAVFDIKKDTEFAAYNISEDRQSVKRFKNACGEIGADVKFINTLGGSDNNHFVNNGLDSLVVSCGYKNAHTTAEIISLEDLAKSAELALALITAKI